ncbi:hypothetical protein ES288_D11G382700v1 [Gossypium darwinii]|uniref:AAA+ ATPase domain-containing protein n=1 Tax=Gossypium darwinii TaxID=34276 RepID=A0A5D2ATT1_GOSDA|nr:hypothetical protein ES288_D11G382700v1 [Gossypium darwinii]
MEVITGTASNLVTGVVRYVFQKIRRDFSYVCRYRRMVSGFEKKVETLKDKRDRVLLDVDAARKNDENIYPEVNSWLAKADEMIDLELKEVKGLEDEAKNKCFIGFCPNFKARYQLSKKAEEDAGAVDELLQQGGLDKVSYRDVPQPVVVVPPKDIDDFDSRKLVFNEIMEAVKDPNLNIIGVYGMPGVGKTTLAKEVIRQVKEDKLFDSVVMAVVNHTPDIKKIQDQIAEMLGLTFKEQSMSGRASRLCQRLKKEKKIFVVLDDIWAKLDLMEVGIPFGDEHQGCTMLLTSRDLNVLSKDMDAKMRYSIGVLEHEEAWEFFKKIAGDGVESSDLLPIATEVAKKCGGLPIAIRTLATSLRNEPPFVWEDALRQLNRPSSSNFIEVSAAAYSSIEWSYDRLQSEEHKQIFLLCSLLGHNVSFQGLLVCAMGLGLFRGVNTVEETRNRLLTVVSHLKASCLLLDGYNNLHVDMHDLICDVAMSIAANHVFVLRDEDVLNDWPDDETMKECDKILLECPSINKLPDQLKCPKLTFFGMDSYDPLMKIPENFFKEMKNLQVLILSDMNLSSLPSSISLLPNLGTLCLVECALGDIALIGELKNLEILSFDGSDIEMLPEEIGQLTKLKWLDLTNCSKLKRIPPGVFCKLSRLEELYVDDCFVGWGAEGNFSQESNCSVAELNALSCLTTLEIHFPNAKIIPKGFSFEKLRRYIIFIGEGSDWDWGWVREYSRTLKLSLQTSISFLNNGVKVLLKKAENLYIDEVKGVEILLHESEGRDYFQQLKNLHIQNGAVIQYILKDNGDVHKIEFQLETLTLQDLPKLVSFCSENEGSTSISPQGTTLFNPKTLFPKLKDLVLCSISIERIWLPQAFCSTPNLTKLIIKGCTNLKYVLFDSMVEYLQWLECLEISECKCVQEIISTDDIIKEAFKDRYLIRFPRLNTLKLKGLQKLIGFCHEDYNVEFPTLKILKIESCPKLKGFIHNSKSKEIPIDAVFFNNKVAFPNLEKIKITHLKNAKRIWHSKLHRNSFSMLKELTIKECDVLLNIFPPFHLGVFQRLEKLIVIDCASLEEVFQFQVQGLEIEETYVVDSQLREVDLIRLPRLKHVWTKYHKGNISFESLQQVFIQDCWNLKTLFPFSIAKGLQQLEGLFIESCGLEEIVSKNDEGSDEQEIWFAFNQLSFLTLWHLPYLTCFYPGIHRTTWSALKKLKMAKCWKIKIFGHEESQIQNSLFLIEKVIPQLEEVSFSGDCIKMISDGQYESDLFCNIKFLRISSYSDVSVVFLISFLRRFYNLESLELGSCSFKELASFENDACEDQDMIITIPKVKKLRLDLVNNIRHLWKQDSPLGHIFPSLECLEVWNCGNLINSGLDLSFSENLTTLDVFKCHEMLELITSSKAQSLACLVTMRIRECERMREVVASDKDETSYEIVFRALKCLELHCLQSLTSFCSRNYTLRFPSLEQVTLSQCPRMKNFNKGELTTPKLEKVQLTQTDFTGRWAGDLNATVEQLYQEQVGYRGLKHLKLSKFPELVDIWSRNPQEMLDFTTLEFLEVCDSNNLRYIFNLSMAFGLGQLRQMEIKRCGNLEQVIKEEGPITMVEEAITDSSKIICIFPRLRSIIVESCPDMTSFYMGSKGLECPSLVEIKIVDCSNMTTFVCTFSRDEDKEVIIGDEVDEVNVIFSDKVAFPNLKKITISHLRNAKRIWHSTLHKNSFSMLKELIVEECDVLLNIFSPFLLGVFQRLEKLIVIDCASLEEVFQFQVQGLNTEETDVVASQLREVILVRLPRLKHVWTNLQQVGIRDCWNLKTLFPFSIAKGLRQLERLAIDNCGLEEIVSNNDEGSDEQQIWFAFNQLSFLMLWHLPYLTCFYPRMHRTTWSALKKLKMAGCRRIKIFGHEESQIQNTLFLIEKVIPQLEEVSFTGDCIKMISDGQYESDLFCNMKFLRISSYSDVSVVFLISFLRRFYNLESLELFSCSFKELASFENDACEDQDMIITIPKVKKLRLDLVNNIRHLWKQDYPLGHIFPSLECLEVWNCGNLINSGLDLSFSENLSTLDVFKCHEMLELITSSKARSLACLVTVRIRECERMREVVASDEDETSYEIVFRALKCLELHCLQSLSSFCSRNYALRFPSLEQVTLSQCPRMKNFNQGELTTPKLQKVQLTQTDFMGRWAGDLNATVEQLYQEQVGYRGLKHLKLSEVPELVDIWSRNPQEMLDFTTLEFLEVCDSNNLRYIFNLSMAFGLGQLRQMEIKRCRNLEQVIKEEGPITMVEEAITDSSKIISIFPRLRSVIVESCPDMTSFYMGSKGLECPSLVEIKVADCSNMTTFVSTFSGDEDKKDIIGVEVDNVAIFFSNKVVFLKLEKLTISHLRNVKRMWYKQLCSKSFSNLKELEVEHCDSLLNIFPHFFLGVFQRLEKLRVTDCASLEEVFQLQIQMLDIEAACIVTSKLRQVELFRLPKLKHVWNKYPNENISFENLREVHVQECWSLKTLFPFSMAKDLQQLESLIVDGCGVEEIVSKSVEESDQHEMLFEFNQLSFLALWTLPNLVCFYPGMHNITCPMLKRLRTYWPTKTKMFGNVVLQLLLSGKIIPQLEHISLTIDDIATINSGQFAIDLFSHIKVLEITEYLNDSTVFSFRFLQRFSNLEKIEMVDCNFKELSPDEGDVGEERDMTMLLPRINQLTFKGVDKMTHLWKQGSPLHHICANLETLEVYKCGNLINIARASSSLRNLTTLEVWYCKEMAELITSSNAQCLEQLVTLKIDGCEMMGEVIASDGDEATYHEIIFKELKCLELYDLQNLKSFCSGNYTLKFPSLDEVYVSKCPAMEIFCNGGLSTPKLQEVQTRWDVRRCWDLNATIEQLNKEECEMSEETDKNGGHKEDHVP